jgi:hypothetical protein
MEQVRIERIVVDADPFRPGVARWRDPDGGAAFRRVLGGMAWPHDVRPGALVILAEHAGTMPGRDTHRIDVVAEFQDADMGALLSRAAEWRERFACRSWVTPMDAPEVALLNDFNAQRRRYRLPVLDCAAPPAVNGKRDFAAYHRLLERRTRAEKTLFLGEGSQVAREYKVRQKGDAAKRLELFPVIAAFLWALADIEMNGRDAAGPWRGGAADKLGGY